MTRGFITIATGKKHYYEIAANLLRSYRFFTKDPMPFAIIAEEENEYTALFDDVILTDESTHSFMDKFLLLKLCPYDETVFFDSDSLAYGDLNVWWDYFKDATDVSAIGENPEKNDDGKAWYRADDIWKYKDLIDYKCRVHSGVMFIRKSEKLKKVYEDCMDVYRNYDKLRFHTCPNSYDEATLGIAMPMNGMKAVEEDPALFGAYPFLKKLTTDMFKPRLSFFTEWGGFTEKSVLLHFGTYHTYGPRYRFDVECLDYLIENKGKKASLRVKLLYYHRLRFYMLKVPYKINNIIFRIKKKLTKKRKK